MRPQELPRIRVALLADEYEGRKNPFETGLARQGMFVKVLVGLSVLARASLLSTFCPTVDDLELPDPALKDDDGNSAYDADGIPEYILLTFRKWKRNAGKKTQVCGACWHGVGAAYTVIPSTLQTLMIRRNTVNPEYCVVTQLLLWLKMAHITHGPIFPDCTDNVYAGLTLGVRCTEPKYIRNLKEVFVYVGGALEKCTSHSIRIAGVSWAARCGLITDVIKVIGRWAATSSSFIGYYEHGIAIARKYTVRLHTTSDPIFAFWCFPTTFMEMSVTGSRFAIAQAAAEAAALVGA